MKGKTKLVRKSSWDELLKSMPDRLEIYQRGYIERASESNRPDLFPALQMPIYSDDRMAIRVQIVNDFEQETVRGYVLLVKDPSLGDSIAMEIANIIAARIASTDSLWIGPPELLGYQSVRAQIQQNPSAGSRYVHCEADKKSEFWVYVFSTVAQEVRGHA